MTPFCAALLDRRIKCDRSSPICINCRRSRRNCTREPLSWPRKQDRRRLIVGPTSRLSSQSSRFTKAHFLNISAWHIDAYHALQDISLSSGRPQSDKSTSSSRLIFNYPTLPQLGQIPLHPPSFPSILRNNQDGIETLSYCEQGSTAIFLFLQLLMTSDNFLQSTRLSRIHCPIWMAVRIGSEMF